MTVDGIIKKVRFLLQDNQSPYRWEDEDIKSAIQEGLAAVNAIRPETRYVNGVLTDFIEVPNDNFADISMNNRYEEAIVYYAVHKCYMMDNSDTINFQLSESYLSKFNTKVQL